MLEMLVSPLGFEPRTKGLKVPCSTAELRARGATLPGATGGASVTGLTRAVKDSGATEAVAAENALHRA